MEKYLISVDLDDTLLTSEKQITQESIEYIRHLVSLGHHFIINTGRPFQGALRFLKTLLQFFINLAPYTIITGFLYKLNPQPSVKDNKDKCKKEAQNLAPSP